MLPTARVGLRRLAQGVRAASHYASEGSRVDAYSFLPFKTAELVPVGVVLAIAVPVGAVIYQYVCSLCLFVCLFVYHLHHLPVVHICMDLISHISGKRSKPVNLL